LASISSFFELGKKELVMFLRKRAPLIEDDPEASRASEAPAVTYLLVWKPFQAAALLLVKLNNAVIIIEVEQC
jgi:hypothetical protein